MSSRIFFFWSSVRQLIYLTNFGFSVSVMSQVLPGTANISLFRQVIKSLWASSSWGVNLSGSQSSVNHSISQVIKIDDFFYFRKKWTIRFLRTESIIWIKCIGILWIQFRSHCLSQRILDFIQLNFEIYHLAVSLRVLNKLKVVGTSEWKFERLLFTNWWDSCLTARHLKCEQVSLTQSGESKFWCPL